MRKFDGKDLVIWILQMEQYFDLYNVKNTQKVRIETLHLEQNTFVWYRWICSHKKIVNPNIIVSDRDPIFTRNFWTKLFSCLGTQLAHSSYYHPKSHGKTKIVNKCFEGYIYFFVSNKRTQWVKWLPLAEWWYNTSFHIVAKMTPFMALYGYHPPSTHHL